MQLDRNYGARICDEWSLKGLRAAVLENELLRVTVLVDKGSDIWEFLYKPLDIDYMWRAPRGLRNPYRGRATREHEGGPFEDFYEGAWQDILPSGGRPNTHNGVQYGLHGEASNMPWDCRVTLDTPEEVECLLSARLLRLPLRIEKTLRLKAGEAVLRIEERIVNESPEHIDFMWGQHIALGEPFLNEHCRLDAPARKIEIHPHFYTDACRFELSAEFDWPIAAANDGQKQDFRRIPSRETRSEDMCYLTNLTDTWYALTDPRRKAGFGFRWEGELYNCIWYWGVFGGSKGHPFYSRTYNLALEPFTSHPGEGLAGAVERGRAVRLEPHGEVNLNMLAVAHAGLEQVGQIAPDGTVS